MHCYFETCITIQYLCECLFSQELICYLRRAEFALVLWDQNNVLTNSQFIYFLGGFFAFNLKSIIIKWCGFLWGMLFHKIGITSGLNSFLLVYQNYNAKHPYEGPNLSLDNANYLLFFCKMWLYCIVLSSDSLLTLESSLVFKIVFHNQFKPSRFDVKDKEKIWCIFVH